MESAQSSAKNERSAGGECALCAAEISQKTMADLAQLAVFERSEYVCPGDPAKRRDDESAFSGGRRCRSVDTNVNLRGFGVLSN